MNGKENVMLIEITEGKQQLYLATQNSTNFQKWFKTFKSINENNQLQKQKEKEKLKFEISQVALDKSRAQNAFGITFKAEQ